MFRIMLLAAAGGLVFGTSAMAQTDTVGVPVAAHHHHHKKRAVVAAPATETVAHLHREDHRRVVAVAAVVPGHLHRHGVVVAGAAPAVRVHHRVRHGVIVAAPVAVAAAAVAAPVLAPPVAPDLAKGSDSGLPVPRFAALRSDEVSLRAGPGTQYPIEWVYQRRYLPVKIEREFEVWRLVSEPDGTQGWVHQAMLTGRRGFLIDGDQDQTIRVSADAGAAAVAVLKPGVVGRLISCASPADWCQVEVQTYKGWLPRDAFFGTLPGEVVAE